MLLVSLILAVAIVLVMVSGAVGWLSAALPFAGERGVLGGLTLIALLGTLAFALQHEARQGRRYNGCLISPYRIWVFGREGGSPSLAREVAQEDVRSWKKTPSGLLLHVAGDGPIYRRLNPLLVPTDNDEELALAECLLRGEDPLVEGLVETSAAGPGAELAQVLARERAEWQSFKRTLGISPPE